MRDKSRPECFAREREENGDYGLSGRLERSEVGR